MDVSMCIRGLFAAATEQFVWREQFTLAKPDLVKFVIWTCVIMRQSRKMGV